MRLLLDAGMGPRGMEAVKKEGIDLLVLSHCHLDHRLTTLEIPEVPVWCHEDEAPYLKDQETFITGTGFNRGGFNIGALFGKFVFPHTRIQKTLSQGDHLELGGLTVEVISTPGHTPGHMSFFIPEAGVLFTADVDLTPFGPFYGHDFADIDAFIRSIRLLKSYPAKTVVTGHAGPFRDSVKERFNAFEEVIYRRDRLLLKQLEKPLSLKDLLGKNLFYPYYPEPQTLIRWFEQVHIEKQFQRLIRMGEVAQENGCYRRRLPATAAAPTETSP